MNIFNWFKKSETQILVDKLIKDTRLGNISWKSSYHSTSDNGYEFILEQNTTSISGVAFDLSAGGSIYGWSVTLYVDGCKLNINPIRLYNVVRKVAIQKKKNREKSFVQIILDKIGTKETK